MTVDGASRLPAEGEGIEGGTHPEGMVDGADSVGVGAAEAAKVAEAGGADDFLIVPLLFFFDSLSSP
jgi:hypothetical protein